MRSLWRPRSRLYHQIQCIDTNASGDCDIETLYDYDAYGNLVDDGVNTYSYDAAMRLISVTDGVTTTSHTYNGDGDRISQTVDSVTTTYVIDTATPLTMVLSETTGTETTFYLHGLDLVAQSDGTNTSYFGSYDENSLLYLRARYYDPGVGRFFNADPSWKERNLYQYSY